MYSEGWWYGTITDEHETTKAIDDSFTDPYDWFLKKAAKENKIKKLWRKLWK